MQKQEKQVRKCIVTGEHFNKAEMLRIVSFRGGALSLDITGKAEGRGCYVSLDNDNLEKLLEKNGALLARTFKRKITDEELQYLKDEFPKAVEEKRFRPKHSKNVVVKVSKKEFNDIVKKS